MTWSNDGYSTTDPNIFDNTSGSVSVGYNDNGASVYIYIGFLRWPSVTIPIGAKITAAYVLVSWVGRAGTPTFKVSMEKAANPAAPTTYSDVVGRTLTTNYGTWTWPGSGTWVQSPDLTAVIQELVNAYNYSSGAAMQCLMKGNQTSGQHYGYFYAVEQVGAKLHIEYTLSGTGLVGDGLVGLGPRVGKGLIGQ